MSIRTTRHSRLHEDADPGELRRFLCWFSSWHTPFPLASVLTTCMTGHFRVSSAGAQHILLQAVTLGLAHEEDGRIVITAQPNEDDDMSKFPTVRSDSRRRRRRTATPQGAPHATRRTAEAKRGRADLL